MESARVDIVYTELESLSIELEHDPTVLGPKYLNEVVARCRSFLNKVSRILLEVQREKRSVQKSLAGKEAEFKIRSDEILANDERVKRLPNIADRMATVNLILASLAREVSDLKLELRDLETIEKAVRLRHGELRDTAADIRTQRQLIKSETDTGAFYGDERSTAPVAPTIDTSELDRIFSENEEFDKTSASVQDPVEELAPLRDPAPVVPVEPVLVADIAAEVAAVLKSISVEVTSSEPATSSPQESVVESSDTRDVASFLDGSGEEDKAPQSTTKETKGKTSKSTAYVFDEPSDPNKADNDLTDAIDFSDILKGV
jgi:hypothetical protein